MAIHAITCRRIVLQIRCSGINSQAKFSKNHKTLALEALLFGFRELP